MRRESREAALREKRRYWKNHIESWRSSDMKQSQYCRRHDLRLNRFVYWKKKFTPKVDSPVSLVRLSLPEQSVHHMLPSPQSPLRVVVGTNRCIEVERGFDPIALKQLIHTLERL